MCATQYRFKINILIDKNTESKGLTERHNPTFRTHEAVYVIYLFKLLVKRRSLVRDIRLPRAPVLLGYFPYIKGFFFYFSIHAFSYNLIPVDTHELCMIACAHYAFVMHYTRCIRNVDVQQSSKLRS